MYCLTCGRVYQGAVSICVCLAICHLSSFMLFNENNWLLSSLCGWPLKHYYYIAGIYHTFMYPLICHTLQYVAGVLVRVERRLSVRRGRGGGKGGDVPSALPRALLRPPWTVSFCHEYGQSGESLYPPAVVNWRMCCVRSESCQQVPQRCPAEVWERESARDRDSARERDREYPSAVMADHRGFTRRPVTRVRQICPNLVVH